jgi:hypothetical protein
MLTSLGLPTLGITVSFRVLVPGGGAEKAGVFHSNLVISLSLVN